MKETAFCDLPWTRLKVGPSGEITNCCWQQNGIGNVLSKSFSDLWTNNDTLKNIREEIKNGASKDGQIKFWADNEKSSDIFGWDPKVSIQKGIELYLNN